MDGIELIVNHKIEEDQLPGVDIVFINRIVPNSTLQTVLDLRERYGFKLIIDYDDHWYLDRDHYLYDTYQHFRASELMEAYITEADAVTVTHDRLRDEVLPLNKNVYILPNAVPVFDQFTAKKTDSPLTRIFWAGGVTHKKDIQLLTNPVKRFPPEVMMVMGGYVNGNPEYLSMASAFTNGGKIKHRLIDSLPVDKYYYAYSECDIAVIPLRDTRFNSFKSNLKILEAANIAAPVIVSDVHPYKDFPFVKYVRSQSDWYKWVKWCLDNRDEAAQMGRDLQAYCREHYNFEQINSERKKVFEYVTKEQGKAGAVPGQVQHADSRPNPEPATA